MADHQDAPPPPITPSLYAQKPDAPLSSLPVQLDVDSLAKKLPEQHLEAVAANWRLSCYLATAQTFLQKNGRLARKLEVSDIKPRCASPPLALPSSSLSVYIFL